MKRGEIVTIAMSGDYGKPRPAVLVQSDDYLADQIESTLVCPITSYLEHAHFFRLRIEPTSKNGLTKTSEIMVDKLSAIRIRKLGPRIGALENAQMDDLNQLLRLILALG